MNKELLIKFSKGKCSNEEAVVVLDWLKKKGSKDKLQQFIDEDLVKAIENPNYNVEHDLQHVYEKISVQTVNRTAKKIKPNDDTLTIPINRSQPWWSIAMKIAASIVLIAALAYFIQIKLKEGQLSDTPVVSMEKKENSTGRRSVIYLQDGTRVHLNAESSISYPKVFSDSSRIIHLQGEAYFEVSKDGDRPFTVYSSNISVTVLGTKFDVKNYEDEPFINVVLEEGSVVVNDNSGKNNDEIILDPGKEVNFDKKSGSFHQVRDSDMRKTLSWKNGNIYFKEDNFETVVKTLQRWYGVEFTIINRPVYEWNYTGEFRDQSLQNVLESISYTQGFRYEIKGKEIIIEFGNT